MDGTAIVLLCCCLDNRSHDLVLWQLARIAKRWEEDLLSRISKASLVELEALNTDEHTSVGTIFNAFFDDCGNGIVTMLHRGIPTTVDECLEIRR